MKTFSSNIVKTRKQIAEEYGICDRTFRRWLEKENLELPSRMLAPKEWQLIYEKFGSPVHLNRGNEK